MANESDGETASVIGELRSAGLIPVAIALVVLVGLYGLFLMVLAGLPGSEWNKLGVFGDSFGALTAFLNALTLASIVVTVVLQSRELRDTRRELEKQADAQRQYAQAAREQIQQTERLEYLKLRPMLKVEWLDLDEHSIQYRVRNVGVGPAIVRSVAIVHGEKRVEFDNNCLHDQWKNLLRDSIPSSFGDVIKNIRPAILSDGNRVLLPGEPQALVVVGVRARPVDLFNTLNSELRADIQFRSLSGDDYTTATQFNVRRARDSAGNWTGGFHHEEGLTAAMAGHKAARL